MRKFHWRELIWKICGEFTSGRMNKMKNGEIGLHYRKNGEILRSGSIYLEILRLEVCKGSASCSVIQSTKKSIDRTLEDIWI